MFGTHNFERLDDLIRMNMDNGTNVISVWECKGLRLMLGSWKVTDPCLKSCQRMT